MTDTAWEKKNLTQKILDRHKQLKTLREPYDESFTEIVELYEPGLLAWDKNTEGEFRGEKIYEGTPPWALRIMADGWIGNLISEGDPWLKYLLSDLAGVDDANKWLQDLEDHMYPVYRESEFYQAMPSYARAALSVGSPVIIPWEDRTEGKVKCEVPHPRENYHGPYSSYHREFQKTVLDAVIDFLKGKIPTTEEELRECKLSRQLLDDYNNGKHFAKYTFIWAIYRQDDPILNGQKREYRNKPWMEFYVQKGTSDVEQDKEPIKVQGYWTRPHIRWDYEINDDEFYARTPAWHSMNDTRSGQEMAKALLERGEQDLHPPMWVQRKYKNRLHLAPRGRTYYDQAEEKENIPEAIIERSNYQVGKDVHDTMADSVRRWFHVDLFRALSQMAKEKKGWPTATQILHLKAEQVTLLGPLIGRFTNVLREIDTRFMDIERRAGRLPPPPDIVIDYMAEMQRMGNKKIRIDVEFIGPLMQVQQRSLAIRRIEAGLAVAGKFMEVFGSQLAYKIRASVAMEKALEQIGFSQDAIVPEDEYQYILAEIAQREEKLQQAEQMKDVIDAVPNLSKDVEPKSPIAGLLEAGKGAG